MKKILLVLGSWIMILMGITTFSSCGDDEDSIDNDNSCDASSFLELVEANKDFHGVKIEGNNVIGVSPFDIDVMVFHFNGDKMECAYLYLDFQSEEIANMMWENMKQNGDTSFTVMGHYLVEDDTDSEWVQKYKGLSKQALRDTMDSQYEEISFQNLLERH